MKRLVPWIIICISVAVPVLLYLSSSRSVNPDHLLMPLDDSYIHFQYARQMASGDPYHYNSGDEATSGATSFLYIPLLAIGYAAGLKGLSLGIWAVLLGVLCHLGSTWLVYQLLANQPVGTGFILSAEKQNASDNIDSADSMNAVPTNDDSKRIIHDIPLLLAIAYGVSGAFVWAAVSGMETSLFIFAVLLTLYFFQREQYEYALLAAALAALIRPEGAVIALTTMMAVWWQHRQVNKYFLMLPLAAIFVQPILNLLLTGSITATGTLAKSHLYNVSAPMSERLTTILELWLRMWRELATGQSEVDGWYLIPLLTLPALLAMLFSIRTSLRQKTVSVGLLAVLWMIGLTLVIATLDTAFWHFKRYQLPVMALMFPLAGWLILRIKQQLAFGEDAAFRIYAGIILVFSLYTCVSFAIKYHDNVMVVDQQQLAMAQWVDANLPANARVGVHDVGMMRYVGNRRTYDVVGLTTPNAALAWRQGGGTIYETMLTHPDRPDYFAIYPNVQALPFLVEAGIFGEELARFEMELPRNTVASATGLQVVTRANWTTDPAINMPQQASIQKYLLGARDVQSINVGDSADEERHFYTWHNDTLIDGFVTDVRNLPYVGCEDCQVIDGARAITGGEQFRIPSDTGLVVLRVHSAASATLTAGCDGETRQTRVVPNIPGYWVDIAFLVEPDAREFCIQTNDIYYPARYWIYSGSYMPDTSSFSPKATFVEPETADPASFSLLNAQVQIEDSELVVDVVFQSDGNLSRDGKLFLHLYDDINAPPIAQVDTYLGDALPPANWLPGIVDDQVSLSLENMLAGDYTLALGFYDPVSGTRYSVTSDLIENDGQRLFIQNISLP